MPLAIMVQGGFAKVMGHDSVLAKDSDVSALVSAGLAAGVAHGYVPENDTRQSCAGSSCSAPPASRRSARDRRRSSARPLGHGRQLQDAT